MTLSAERISKARKAGYDDDAILNSIESKDPEFSVRIKRAREAGYDSKSIINSIEKRLSQPQVLQEQQPVVDNSTIQPETSGAIGAGVQPQTTASVLSKAVENKETSKTPDKSLFNYFDSGIRNSTSGKISQAVFNDQDKPDTNDPDF